MRTLTLIIVLLLSFIVIGCKPLEADLESSKKVRSYNEQAIQKCLQTGGIPIINVNGGFLQDCRWKGDVLSQE